jgi:pimeloyl-ACP methyl ester carboxylesterase
MTPQFIQFKTSDGLVLPGLYYKTDKAKKIVIFVHGLGSSSTFYNNERDITVAGELAKHDVSFLSFNNRGADGFKRVYFDGIEDKQHIGYVFEKIADSIQDIDAAVEYAKSQGYDDIILMGHSTGANKVVLYNYYKPQNDVSKYILMGGGDDTGLHYEEFGHQKFDELLKKSYEMERDGHGEDIATEVLPFIISYKSLFDMLNPDGDYNIFPFYEVLHEMRFSTKKLFQEYLSIKKPTLVIYGAEDKYCWGDVSGIVEILKKYQPGFRYEIIDGADHGFNGKEDELAKQITLFVPQD